MKADNYISKKERRLLLTVALAALLFSFAGSIAYGIRDYNERKTYYRIQEEKLARNEPTFSGAYCFPDKHPQFLFKIIIILGLTFSSLCLIKSYLPSFLLTVVSFSMYVYWFFDTKRLLASNE